MVLLYLIPTYVLFVCLEFIISLFMYEKLYSFKDTFVNFCVGLVWLILELTVGKYYHQFLHTFLHHPWALSKESWITWIILLVFYDFAMYWSHRWSHTYKILWVSHSVQHSAKKYNLSNAIRQSWTGILFAPSAWLVVLGFHPSMLQTVRTIAGAYQWCLFTKLIKCPRFVEYIFVTPRYHYIHHQTHQTLQTLQTGNYGLVFTVWDRIFGTTLSDELRSPTKQRSVDRSYNPFIVMFREWITLVTQYQGGPSI